MLRCEAPAKGLQNGRIEPAARSSRLCKFTSELHPKGHFGPFLITSAQRYTKHCHIRAEREEADREHGGRIERSLHGECGPIQAVGEVHTKDHPPGPWLGAALLVKKPIASHIGLNPETQKKMLTRRLD